jgi:hypothetical protein
MQKVDAGEKGTEFLVLSKALRGMTGLPEVTIGLSQKIEATSTIYKRQFTTANW